MECSVLQGIGRGASRIFNTEKGITMKPENPRVTAGIDSLQSAFGVLAKGCTIAWEDMERVLDMTRDSHLFRYTVKKWRRNLLRDRGIATWPEYTVGLRLLTDSEQVTIPARARQRRAVRQIRRAIREVSAADDSQLTMHMRLSKRAHLEAMAIHERMIESTARRPATESLPQRPVTTE